MYSWMGQRCVHQGRKRHGVWIEKGPAGGFGVYVITQERPLGVPGSVSSSNQRVFRKAYWVSQGILRSIVERHTMLSVAGEPVRDPLRSLPAHSIFFNYPSMQQRRQALGLVL